MVLEKLPTWAFPNSNPAFYDAESVTAIDATAKLHGKMNETIEAVNQHIEECDTKLEESEQNNTEWRETTERAMRQEFQDFIDTVELKLESIDNGNTGTGTGTGSTTSTHKLWEGTAKYGDSISINSFVGASYYIVEVESTDEHSSNGSADVEGVRVQGFLTTRDYYGNSISASGVVVGSGGFPYHIVVSLTIVNETQCKVNKVDFIRYTGSSYTTHTGAMKSLTAVSL